MAIIRAIVGLALALMWVPASAADYPAPKQGEWIARDFKFHGGETLAEVELHYTTVGEPGGIPVVVKDVAKVSVGYLPRLGKAGRDADDDVVTAIVIMNRTLRTNEVLARVKAEIQKINSDGTLPPGVRAVPVYDRGSLVSVTTHTVLHNLVFNIGDVDYADALHGFHVIPGAGRSALFSLAADF